MNLHNTPEDKLCREIWAKRSEWDSQKLTNEVYLAVRDNHPRRLVRLIDELVAGVKMQRTTIIEQE